MGCINGDLANRLPFSLDFETEKLKKRKDKFTLPEDKSAQTVKVNFI